MVAENLPLWQVVLTLPPKLVGKALRAEHAFEGFFYDIEQLEIQNMKDFLYRNYEFANITPFYTHNPFFELFDHIKKLRCYAMKFVFAFLFTLWFYVSYSTFVSSVDGFDGIRTVVLKEIQLCSNPHKSMIDHIESSGDESQAHSILVRDVINDAVNKWRLDHIAKLNDELLTLQKLNDKIKDLPLIYFLSQKNKDLLKEFRGVIRDFNRSGSRSGMDENRDLQSFIKKTHFSIFLDTETSEEADS